MKLGMSLTYANSEWNGVTAVPTGSESFVIVPTESNSDILISTLSLRYGLIDKAEVYGRGSYLHKNARNSLDRISSVTDSRFIDAWMGVNYQFKEDDNIPALLGFAEAALWEKHRKSSSSLQSWMIGITTYKAIDPIVFSFTTGYRFNQQRKDGSQDYKPGNFLLLNPSVAFAVNDRVTLTTGLQWMVRQRTVIDNKKGFRRTNTDLQLGVSYGFSAVDIFNVTFNANASGRNGSVLRFNWLHTF